MKISVSRGRTINMGNFESERIDVGIEKEFPDTKDVEKINIHIATLEVFINIFLDGETEAIIEERERLNNTRRGGR